jgi:GPH family glycoside/pentoside/hexuronide:cation symporter
LSTLAVGKLPERLSLGRALSFGVAASPVAALDVALLLYLPPNLTGYLGIPLTVVGLAWAVVRLLDVIVDPVLGVIMDATRSRLGRYRLWMLLGSPILMLSVWMLFFAKPGVGPVFIVVWLLAIYLGRSILHLAHPAWAATLARSYNERSRLFGVLSALGVAAALVVFCLPVINGARHGTPPQSLQLMGWYIIGVTPLTVGWAVWRTGERLNPRTADERVSLSDYLVLLTKPDLVRLYASIGALTLGPGAMTATYIFFMRDHNGFTEAQASILLVVYFLAGIFGAPAMASLATRIGKHRTLMAAAVGYSLGLCTVLYTPYASLLGSIPTMFWLGFMAAAFELLVRSMLADVADQVRLEQGRERLSLMFALNTLVTKVAAAAAVAIIYPILEAIGYQPQAGAHNTAAAIRGLGLLFVSGPIIFVTLGAVCLIGWKMTAERHASIRAELDLRDAGIAATIPLGDA